MGLCPLFLYRVKLRKLRASQRQWLGWLNLPLRSKGDDEWTCLASTKPLPDVCYPCGQS